MSVPSFELGPHTPSPASECVPPGTKVGGQHWPAGKGMGGPNSDDGRESLARCLLCASHRILSPLLYLLFVYFQPILLFIAGPHTPTVLCLLFFYLHLSSFYALYPCKLLSPPCVKGRAWHINYLRMTQDKIQNHISNIREGGRDKRSITYSSASLLVVSFLPFKEKVCPGFYEKSRNNLTCFILPLT